MTPEEKEKRAAKIMGNRAKETLDSDSPLYLSVLALRDVILTLADDENEAFTQLNVGSEWFQKFSLNDETKMFAEAIHYAEHPYDDIEDELNRRGINEKIIMNEVKMGRGQEVQYIQSLEGGTDEKTGLPLNFKVKTNEDGTTSVIKYIEKPLHFTNLPLSRFAHEWMKRRVPTNRKRVEELIDLASALSKKIESFSAPPQARVPELPRRV